MSSLASLSPLPRGQIGPRRLEYTPAQSDCPPETESSPGTVKRSASLTTLQPTVFEPRMAQLETLEAKMASIEVSLSSTPRRKKNGSLSGVSLGGSNRSIPKEIAVKELESLRNALRDKENIIQSLKGQLSIPGLRLTHIRNGNGICNNNNTNSTRELSEVERKQAEERLSRLRNDTDTKRLAIKNLKMALERLDITDNIDVRIQQAELEYQLGREELNLLTLLEETRALQHCLEESNKKASDSHTLYSCISGNDVSLHTTEIVYDPKSPRFGAGQKESCLGLYVDWALEDTGLSKGDRLIEVNGKIVLTKSREDLARLLQAAPDPAFIVVLRKGAKGEGCQVTSSTNGSREVAALRCELEVVKERAEEAQRAKDGLRSDNIRLTHRISYLEEQVSELLSRKPSEGDIRIVNQSPVITSTVKTSQNITNINIRSQPSTVISQIKEPQVFQKGPQMTTLVSNVPGLDMSKETHTQLPVRSKSSLSNVSNTHIPAPSPQPSDYSCHKSHRHKHRSSRNGLMLSSSTQNLDQAYKKHHHHHHHREKDYNSESNSGVDNNYRSRKSLDNSRLTQYNESNLMDQSYRKATKIVQDLTKNKETLYEKHRSKCIGASEKYNSDVLRHYNARKSTSVLDFRSEIHIGPKYTSDSRSVEELDAIDHKTNGRRLYKKLHDARSVKSLDFDSDCNYPNPNNQKNIDYTSEPIDNHKVVKPRPTPPKKPLRLSLHRAQSLQSVETPTPNGSPPQEKDSRKPMKRNHKGEPPLVNGHVEKNSDQGQSKNENQIGNVAPRNEMQSRIEGQTQSRNEGQSKIDYQQPRTEGQSRNDYQQSRTEGQSRNDYQQSRIEGQGRNEYQQSRIEGQTRNEQQCRIEGQSRNDYQQSRFEGQPRSDHQQSRIEGRNDPQGQCRNDAQLRNEGHLQSRSDSRTENHTHSTHLQSIHETQHHSRNDAQYHSRNETQHHSRNDSQHLSKNDTQYQSGNETQHHSRSTTQQLGTESQHHSRNNSQHPPRNEAQFHSRNDGQFHLRNGEQFAARTEGQAKTKGDPQIQTRNESQFQNHQRTEAQIQSRVEAMNSVNNASDSRWTSFAQKKDNLVYINDRRGWC